MTKVNSQKYSKALLEVAQDKGQLDSILAEVNELDTVLKENKLGEFFANEVYPDSAKSEVVDSLQNSASDLLKNFLSTVRANGRLSDLTEIIAEIKNSADDMFKIADVEVISSVPLTESQIAKLETLSKAKFDLNEVKIVNKVDENILGGFQISSRGKIIDATIKTQLAKIATEIL